MTRQVVGDDQRFLGGTDQAHAAGGPAHVDRLTRPDPGVLHLGNERGVGLNGFTDAGHHRRSLPLPVPGQLRRADLVPGWAG